MWGACEGFDVRVVRLAAGGVMSDLRLCSVHEYTAWYRPIGQVKARTCLHCGRIQSWEEYLHRLKRERAVDVA